MARVFANNGDVVINMQGAQGGSSQLFVTDEELYNTALKASRSQDRAELARFFTCNPQFQSSVFPYNVTTLQFAASHGHENLAVALIEREPSLVSLVYDNHKSVLFMACSIGNKLIVEKLWDLTPPDLRKGCLHAAIRSGNKDLVDFIMEKESSIVYEMHNGQCPIHVAARENDLEIMKMILQRSSYAVELLNKDGKNALHIAMENERLSMIEYLFEQPYWWVLAMEGNDEDGTLFLKITKSMDITALQRLDAIISAKRKGIYKDKLTKHVRFIMKQRENQLCYQYVVPSLIVGGTLVATVACQATFNVPGGFTPEGVPALSKNKWFQKFMEYNTATMGLTSGWIIIGILTHTVISLGARTPFPIPPFRTLVVIGTWMMGVLLFFFTMATSFAVRAMMPDLRMTLFRYDAYLVIPMVFVPCVMWFALSYKDVKYMLKGLLSNLKDLSART